jgi:hypothetical protein
LLWVALGLVLAGFANEARTPLWFAFLGTLAIAAITWAVL